MLLGLLFKDYRTFTCPRLHRYIVQGYVTMVASSLVFKSDLFKGKHTSLWVCMLRCLRVCSRVRLFVRSCRRVGFRTFHCVRVRAGIRTCVFVFAFASLCACAAYVYVCFDVWGFGRVGMRACVHAGVRACVCACVYGYLCVRVCMCVWACVCVKAYVFAYSCARVHMCGHVLSLWV